MLTEFCCECRKYVSCCHDSGILSKLYKLMVLPWAIIFHPCGCLSITYTDRILLSKLVVVCQSVSECWIVLYASTEREIQHSIEVSCYWLGFVLYLVKASYNFGNLFWCCVPSASLFFMAKAMWNAILMLNVSSAIDVNSEYCVCQV